MIQVKNLSYTYLSTTNPAVKKINFSIQPGEIFGFLGPSGAGKSTTQKVLIRLLRDYQGNVNVLGKDLGMWGQDFFEQIGVSFELPNHYSKLTGLENLGYFSSLYQSEIRDIPDLLESVGLENDGNMLVSQYSKGMKNRLNVARAMLHNPELLFLDEPTAGLDPVNARRIKDLCLEEKRAGKTIFLTTHDMTVADELCDRLAFIIDGELSLVDSPSSLKIKYGKPEVKVEFGPENELSIQTFPLQGLAENQDYQGILKTNQIRTMHTQEATLEDIFIQVTGRTLI